MSTTTLDQLNAMTPPDFVAALGDVFEHSPWIAQAAAVARPFATVSALHEAMLAAVRSAPDAMRLAFLRAHPELAGLQARAGTLTVDSTAEQASLGLQALPRTDTELFAKLNAAYNARFGFPFIICVRHHTRDAILAAFERRLHNDAATETAAALAEIAAITRLRLVAKVTGPGLPNTHGHLSTHVLNTAIGRPAAGVRIELHQIGPRGEGMIVSGVTNKDGRTEAPLIADAPLRIGAYELRFHMGDYFRGLAMPLAEPAYFDIVPVRLSIAEPTGHYHAPLLASPWSYTTYRGS
jgi:2-oxo-4-hydroxy-4-carboxy-5-ureidoimidazoline decarboxylase